MSWDQRICQSCGTTNAANRDACFSCGKPFAANAASSASSSLAGYQGSSILGIGGILLIVFGTLRWNSAASQVRRLFGQTDGLATFLFVSGAVALIFALVYRLSMFDTTSVPGTNTPIEPSPAEPSNKSVEPRLRTLDDLRSKQLISGTEYQERKNAIVASL